MLQKLINNHTFPFTRDNLKRAFNRAARLTIINVPFLNHEMASFDTAIIVRVTSYIRYTIVTGQLMF